MNAPSKIWICASGKEIPDWIVERMTNPDAIAADGSFEIEATDGVVKVERGFAVFEFNDAVYACPPRAVPEKLATIAAEHPAVVELAEKTEAMNDQRRESRRESKQAPAKKASGEQALRLKPVIGEPPAPQFAAVDRLQIDDTYQRSIEGGASRKLIVKIAENWDWRLCLPLLVSRRGGDLFVIDGQHRLEAARLRGDIPHMPVVVFDFDDPKAEAELFVQANRSRRAMSKLDDFHAAIIAGDSKALAVNEVVTAAGLSVGRIQAWQYWKPGEVVFVTAIQRALHSQGKAVVQQSLSLIAKAFEGLILTGTGPIFEGLCTMLREGDKEGKPLDVDRMETVLRETGIPGWKEAVDGAESGAERAESMLSALKTAYAEAGAE